MISSDSKKNSNEDIMDNLHNNVELKNVTKKKEGVRRLRFGL